MLRSRGITLRMKKVTWFLLIKKVINCVKSYRPVSLLPISIEVLGKLFLGEVLEFFLDYKYYLVNIFLGPGKLV